MKRRRIRRDIKYASIIALSLVALLSIFGALYFSDSSMFKKNNVIVLNNYLNNFSYSYDVKTIPNEFVDYSGDTEYTAYVSNLIDKMNFNFKYKFEDTSGKKSNITYKYNIKGKLLGFYNKDGEDQKVIQKEYTISEGSSNSVKDNTFSINDDFTIEIMPLNDLIKEFTKSQEMPISSRYDIIMNIEIDGVTNSTLTYSPKISLEIGNKTTKVVGDNNVSENITLSNVEEKIKEPSAISKVFVVLLSILSIGCVLRILYLVFYTDEILVVKNRYKGEVNEIIRAFQDRIVMIDNLPEMNTKNIVIVSNVEEIVKLSEELYKPILCFENEAETNTQFFIMSDDTVYKFLINK